MDIRVARAKELLSSPQSPNSAIAGIAKELNLSTSRLRLFRVEVGRSPEAFRRDLRLQNAAWLLAGTFLQVKEIASEVGINDVSHFVRYFRRKYGFAPTEYRRRHQSIASVEVAVRAKQ